LIILLTNDDGIDSPGLEALYESVIDLGEIFVVAPDVEKSAFSHAISSMTPLQVRSKKLLNFEGFAVSGTPADCIKIALGKILDKKPDLIISGINMGANIASNILYSGTVAAAVEGALLGIKSIAISISRTKDVDFTFAKKFTNTFVRRILEISLPESVILNINIPSLNEENIKGIEFTKQGKSIFIENYEERIDFKGNLFYWPDGSMNYLYDNDKYTGDDFAVNHDKVSITPLKFDFTDYKTLEKIKDWNILL
jgi:5'-nucleotidase